MKTEPFLTRGSSVTPVKVQVIVVKLATQHHGSMPPESKRDWLWAWHRPEEQRSNRASLQPADGRKDQKQKTMYEKDMC